MPDTLRLADGSYMRGTDIQPILRHLMAMRCVEIIGFSNVGKSALLRLLAQHDVWTGEMGEAGQEIMPIYIDCNRMLDLTDQGFYELILRCLQESYTDLSDSTSLTEAYRTLVAPASDFQIPLSFNQGLTAALQASNHKLVLLFDEFDEPFNHIHARVFLNLRALMDRHQGRLVYVTATGLPLTALRAEDHCSEFCELFSHRAWHLAPLTRADQERYIRRYMMTHDIALTHADMDFICEWAGGHPRLLEGVCRIVGNLLPTGADEPVAREKFYLDAARKLRQDTELTLECSKVWLGCSEAEQQELAGLFQAGHEANPVVLAALERRHILRQFEGTFHPFARQFGEYVQRKATQADDRPSTLHVDVESGVVYVGGEPVETLTNLEYRLMLLLFQNNGKIVEKYQIVTDVWGDSYIDEVDDARIEKLVSRLRQKIEPESSEPRFLTTVRGRGYRLVVD